MCIYTNPQNRFCFTDSTSRHIESAQSPRPVASSPSARPHRFEALRPGEEGKPLTISMSAYLLAIRLISARPLSNSIANSLVLNVFPSTQMRTLLILSKSMR
jgi:hypothetical protein